MKILQALLFCAGAYVSQAFAHLGHGDHSAIIASGEAHPFISVEHLLLVTLVAAVLFLLGRKAG